MKKPGLWERLLETSPSTERKHILNALAAVMSAVTMVMLQLLTTRTLGAEAAGRVSVDAATVLLCFQLGQLSMRPVQCTDLKRRFSFPEYLTLKTLTCCFMLALCLAYTCIRGYGAERRLFCLGFCIYKALEAFSDCFWGMMQQRERIDLSGLCATVYHLCGITAFAAVLYLSRRLDLAALVMALTGMAHFLLCTLPLGRRMERPGLCAHTRQLLLLVAVLLPLFAAGYFLNVAVTLPKYALERCGDETALGIFAAIHMTAQGVLMLNSFVYFPRVTALARFAGDGDGEGFRRLLLRLGAVNLLLELSLLAGGWLFGAELLGLLFKLPLAGYRMELMLVLLAGGFFGLYTLLSYALIAMRKQKGLALLTLTVLLAAVPLCYGLTSRLGLRGAALAFLLSMALAALLISLKTARALRQMKGGNGDVQAA